MHEPALILDRFLSLLEPPQEVLSVGCSVKADVLAMMQEGIEVIGIEPCNALVGENSQSISTGMFRRMDIRWIKYPPETFTGIWASLSLDHSPSEDISRTLKEFGRVLKTEGVLSINVEEYQGESLDRLKTEQLFYTISDFCASLVEANFQILEDYVCIQSKTSEGSQTKTQTYILAKKGNIFTRPPGALQSSECSFCSVSRFQIHRQIGLQGVSSILWGGDQVYVIPDIAPIMEGHLLIITTPHYICFGSCPDIFNATIHSTKQLIPYRSGKFGGTSQIALSSGDA